MKKDLRGGWGVVFSVVSNNQTEIKMNATQYFEFFALITPNGFGDGVGNQKLIKMIGIDKAGVEAEIREAYTNISHITVSDPQPIID